MVQQAADAVMRAYRHGVTRQTVRFRLDTMFDMEQLYVKGTSALVNETLPVMQFFAARLWGGEYLKEVRTSVVEEAGVGTLLYREAENAMQDAAVIYLPGRDLVTSQDMLSFFGQMKERLVVLANTENAPANWRVENGGMDFTDEFKSSVGHEVCQMFRTQSYYYYKLIQNNWQLTYFRVYPWPFEVYIEDFNFELVKIGEKATKPSPGEVMVWMETYEKANNVSVARKVGKVLKDMRQEEDVSEERDPGWRYKQIDAPKDPE